MNLVTILPFVVFALAYGALHAESLRTGAPSLACMSLRPIHGLHRARPASASQFFVSQSSSSYQPGQNISVDVMTHSNERYFRGFIVQAYDPITGAQIGSFLPSTESRPLEACSASTHRDNLNKKHVSLTWVPPAFTGGLPNVESAANQWLGFRTPRMPQASISWTNRDKRQAAEAATVPAVEQSPNSMVVAPNLIQSSATPPSITVQQDPHQVRFKASIVVTYDEFYTGFDSSDQKYDKWDFVPKPNQ